MNIKHMTIYRFLFLAFFSLAVFLWILSGDAYKELASHPDLTTYQQIRDLDTIHYESMVMNEMDTAHPIPFSLWTQTDNQTITAIEMNKYHRVSWVAICGDVRLVFPFIQGLDPEDYEGCIIDAKSANRLFGNSEVVGNTIQIKNKHYVIRNVINGPSNTIITQLSHNTKNPVDNVTIMGSDNADNFLIRHNLISAIAVRSTSYTFIAGVIYNLPVFTTGLLVLMFFRHLMVRWKPYLFRYILISLIILAIGTALFIFTISNIPSNFVPTKWSDFQFWSSAFDSMSISLYDYISSSKLRPDMYRLGILARTLYGVLSAQLIYSSYSLYHINSIKYNNLLSYNVIQPVIDAQTSEHIASDKKQNEDLLETTSDGLLI